MAKAVSQYFKQNTREKKQPVNHFCSQNELSWASKDHTDPTMYIRERTNERVYMLIVWLATLSRWRRCVIRPYREGVAIARLICLGRVIKFPYSSALDCMVCMHVHIMTRQSYILFDDFSACDHHAQKREKLIYYNNHKCF